jgi:hypothetical protein
MVTLRSPAQHQGQLQSAIPMDKVNEETRSKRAKWRSESAIIPAIHITKKTEKGK